MERRLKITSEKYKKGYNCVQALLAAYAEEMKVEPEILFRITEGLGEGIGGLQEICGAFLGACMVISYFSSEGDMQGNAGKRDVYDKIQRAAAIFEQEYGGIRCKEILNGRAPEPMECGMKVKDAVILVEKVRKEANLPEKKEML